MKGLSRANERTIEVFARVVLPSGHGLPGADDVGLSARLRTRSEWWDPAMVTRVRSLVGALEWSSVPIKGRRLSRLSPEDQELWIGRAYRSRFVPLRLAAVALKQLVALEWGTAPGVESAIGLTADCQGAIPPVEPEPSDYHRPGPAVAGGAIPLRLVQRREAEPPGDPGLETLSWPEITDGFRVTCDAVIVGSGAGGAVVAAELASAGLDVIVVEEGPHMTSEGFTGPVFDRFQRLCRDNGMTQVWGRPPIPLPLGKVVGGTTVVNSGTCFRAPARVLRAWDAEFGLEVANGELDEHYTSIENVLNVRPVPWDVLGPNGRVAHEGAMKLGLTGGPLLRNISDCHGCGECAFGCSRDAKQAMHVSYLPRAARSGARILSCARVDRVTHEGGRATGIRGSLLASDGTKKGSFSIDSARVFVCAGAIHSPALLSVSGIDDPTRLVGRNLRIHPATGVGGFFDHDLSSWRGTLQSYYIDSYFDSHELMFEATTTHPGIGAGSLPGMGAAAMRDLRDLPRLATLGFYVSDTSAGRVRRLPGGEVVATYRLNDLDARRMVLGIVKAAEILMAAGASRVYPGVPGIDSISAQSDLDDLRTRHVRAENLRLTAFHPMGTVRSGRDPSASVVDPYGAHHQMSGLWVADASLFPTCVGVNPQMTIMALARRAAHTAAAAG